MEDRDEPLRKRLRSSHGQPSSSRLQGDGEPCTSSSPHGTSEDLPPPFSELIPAPLPPSSTAENPTAQTTQDAGDTLPVPGSAVDAIAGAAATEPVVIDADDDVRIENRPGANTEGRESQGGERPAGLEGSAAAVDAPAESATCPICMEPWTGDGIHRICCLACGHLFGRSCIRRWLKQAGKKNGKCPHCNRKAKLEDIRNLYVPFLTVLDGAHQVLLEELGVLQSKYQDLTAENDRLNKEKRDLHGLLVSLSSDTNGKSSRFQKTKSYGHDNFGENKFVPNNRDAPFNQGSFREHLYSNRSPSIDFRSSIYPAELSGRSSREKQHAGLSYTNRPLVELEGSVSNSYFSLQDELSLPGARIFDMDSFSQMLLVAQKSSTSSDSCCLNKVSLLSLMEAGVMPLPQGTGTVRDIRIAPPGGKLPGRLALIASLGKRVSLFSMETNNVVLTYHLQSPCWSCSWDPIEPNYIFAGLQDGSMSIFDLRQTSSAMASIHGLYRQPVHTLYSITQNNLPEGNKMNGILGACSSGLCFWDYSVSGIQGCRPGSVPYVDNKGVCVALAYSPVAQMAVATFRPKPFHQEPLVSTSSQSVDDVGCSQYSARVHMGSPLGAVHVPLVLALSTTGETTGGNEGVSSTNGYQVPSLGNVSCKWKFEKPMFGPVNPVGMHRSAIVCDLTQDTGSGLQNLFAFGDEETKSLMLWDVKTLRAIDCLKPHTSSILDVKSINIEDQQYFPGGTGCKSPPVCCKSNTWVACSLTTTACIHSYPYTPGQQA